MYFVLLKEKKQKSNQSLSCTKNKTTTYEKGPESEGLHTLYCLVFSDTFWSTSKVPFFSHSFFQWSYATLTGWSPPVNFLFGPRSSFARTYLLWLNGGVAVRQRLVFKQLLEPKPHKHVACILCHYFHMGGKKEVWTAYLNKCT